MNKLPLFPLNTVLFPGGVLPLRIFEPRYLDMVSTCLKTGNGFAVVPITSGQEAGKPARFNAFGTVARIVDFDQLDDGFLGITCRGGERLQVLRHWIQSDELILAEVERLAAEMSHPIKAHHADLIRLLRDLLSSDSIKPYRQWFEEDWTSTSWVGYRLAELLPLPLDLKGSLLQLNDSGERLALLETILRDNKLI